MTTKSKGKSTMIAWKTKDGGGDSIQFVGRGCARALYEWLNMSKVPFSDIVTLTLMVKED